ncbi:50S ribosomal protein L14e [Nanobdella aerobiophila]|uniref:50S ribosomal protein L14e n=1 Tax=Nanobdella aerobiophila TaxID=2586965 RepID=A0A915WRL9_9ARCH|nr:50S ribosomal protein L14e [Nanobdella aerobiophila]BBL45828.1 50S ribosomal protein L14e [Nanobdella aerobiophila]
MVLQIGRVCIKLSGREAGNVCVITDIIDNKFLLVDGNIKRRRVNIKHIEPTEKLIQIKKGANTEDVIKEMIKNKIPVSYWKLKKENLLNNEIVELYKQYFGNDWEKVAKSLGSPGKKN